MIAEAARLGGSGCWICGHSPRRPWRTLPPESSQLSVHEIHCGPGRSACLDKPFGLLVLCWHCNSDVVTDRRVWPEARQLAVLKQKNPAAFDLVAYNAMVNPWAPRRITPGEVDAFYGKATA
jgi:hypothetical protein